MGDEVSADSRRLRLALVIASMAMGGAERMTVNLATEFARRGHRVDLVLISKRGPLLERLPADIRIVDLGAGRARRAIAGLRRYLSDERPDAVLSVAFQTNILTMIASLGLRPKPRIILSVRNTYGATMAAMRQPKRMLFEAATRLLYPLADGIIGVSKGVCQDLHREAGVPERLLFPVYNPVLDEQFERLAAEPVEGGFATDQNVDAVVTVGRLAEQKDHATLIRAFAKVAAKRPARLTLLGDGELRGRLQVLTDQLGLTDRVRFAGIRANPYPYMREADLFVLSSSWEGFGNVLVEAMATGTSVVATDCPHGPREILEDGKWGTLVPVGDVDALAMAMLKVLDEGGVDARERAKQFTVEAAADQYLALFGGIKCRSAERA